MNIRDAKSFIAMVEKAHAPRFTHTLSFDEQRALNPEQAKAYREWFVSRMERLDVIAARRKAENPNSEIQKDYDDEREAMGYLPGEYP